MRIFNRDAECPKCHGTKIITTHIDKGDFITVTEYAKQECMLRYCSTCKYRWFELPLDSTSNIRWTQGG